MAMAGTDAVAEEAVDDRGDGERIQKLVNSGQQAARWLRVHGREPLLVRAGLTTQSPTAQSTLRLTVWSWAGRTLPGFLCALDESIVNYVKRLSGLTDITSSEFDVTAHLEDGAIIVIEVKAADSNERPALEAAAARVIEGVSRRREFGDRVMVATLTPDLAAQVTQFAKLAADDKRMTERLVSAMFTRNTVSPAAAQQARRNAEARQELIDEFGLFDSDQLAEMAGSKAKNRSATASRWLAERRVFAVEHLGHRYFPAFQFGIDSRPDRSSAASSRCSSRTVWKAGSSPCGSPPRRAGSMISVLSTGWLARPTMS